MEKLCICNSIIYLTWIYMSYFNLVVTLGLASTSSPSLLQTRVTCLWAHIRRPGGTCEYTRLSPLALCSSRSFLSFSLMFISRCAALELYPASGIVTRDPLYTLSMFICSHIHLCRFMQISSSSLWRLYSLCDCLIVLVSVFFVLVYNKQGPLY